MGGRHMEICGFNKSQKCSSIHGKRTYLFQAEQTLQENDNSSIESIFEGIYEIEELVLNREADASNDERLVMMQTLRDIRHLLEELKIRKGYNY